MPVITIHLPDIYEHFKAQLLSQQYAIAGGQFKRIYFYHIESVGGSSVNHAFCSLLYNEKTFSYNQKTFSSVETYDIGISPKEVYPGSAVYIRLAKSRNKRLMSNGKAIVGWNEKLICEGDWFYAFSHAPAERLKLKPETFTFTCLRDLIERIVSWYKKNASLKERNRLGFYGREYLLELLDRGFDCFLENVPKSKILGQLYMFSNSFSINEAVENILSCNDVLFTGTLNDDFERLCDRLGVRPDFVHANKSNFDFKPTQDQIERMRSILEPEYVMLEKVRKLRKNPSLSRSTSGTSF